jgi:hypothetical protein
VFIAGRNQMLGLPKSNLSTAGQLSVLNSGNYSLVSNLKTQQLYALVDDSFRFLTGPGTVSNLLPLDGSSGVYVTGKRVSLSQPIELVFGSGLFSGWNRIVLIDKLSSTAFNVDLLNGMVQELQAAVSRWQTGEGWASWGVTEYTGYRNILIPFNSSSGAIERQNLFGANIIETVHGSSLGAISSFTIDTALNRWYFYYSGVSGFGNYSGAVGYADASWASGHPSAAPTLMPATVALSLSPTARPSIAPSKTPSAAPSLTPTAGPSVNPTFIPSAKPSRSPTTTVPSKLPQLRRQL